MHASGDAASKTGVARSDFVSSQVAIYSCIKHTLRSHGEEKKLGGWALRILYAVRL
jgi:hypothetical protein